jgi:hypothetical protein
MKIFKFVHSDGAEIIAAENAKEAIMFFFTEYVDDIQTDDMIEFDGIKIEQVNREEAGKKRLIYNEDTGRKESVSYLELAYDLYNGQPTVLVSSFY